MEIAIDIFYLNRQFFSKYFRILNKIQKMTQSTQSIHLWIPELFCSKGGIQVFSGFLLQAVQDLYPDANLSVVLKNDKRNDKRHDSKLDSKYGLVGTSRIVNQDSVSHRQLKIQTYYSGAIPSPLRTLFFALQLIWLAIAQKPDLVIMTHINFAPIAFLLKKIIGTKYIAIAHGVEAWDIKNPLLKKSLQAADQILAVSNFTRDQLCQDQNLSPQKISILHNTFDANAWKIKGKSPELLKKYGLRADQKIILTVSRLVSSEQYKGYDRILEALPVIRQTIPDIHYIIVGKGCDRDRIEKIIQHHDLQNHVTLTGFIPDEHLCDYYNLCDLFVMPSKREGFGIVYLEALACGKPVLAGNLDGAVDALCQGEIGVLINPNNLQKITETIIQIISGTYKNQVIYQPEILRNKVICKFGIAHFQKTLTSYLSKI